MVQVLQARSVGRGDSPNGSVNHERPGDTIVINLRELPPDADENDLDPEIRALLEKPISDERFAEILEKIAPNNPYAAGLLEAARRKGVGGK